jgi:phage baseplate assembly protein W
MSGMQGISPQLPLIYSNIDGPYKLNKTLGESIRQNFKNLLLTSPGERIMLPQFGCGLRRLLFEGFSPTLHESIRTQINRQVNTYLPFVNVETVNFLTHEFNSDLGLNELAIEVIYNLGSLDTQDTLTIT